MGRSLTADEMRQGILDAAQSAASMPMDHAGEPSFVDKQAAKMLLDAFGTKVSVDPAPHTKELHRLFIQATHKSTSTDRTLTMLPFGKENGMVRGYARFFMVRDWEKKED